MSLHIDTNPFLRFATSSERFRLLLKMYQRQKASGASAFVRFSTFELAAPFWDSLDSSSSEVTSSSEDDTSASETCSSPDSSVFDDEEDKYLPALSRQWVYRSGWWEESTGVHWFDPTYVDYKFYDLLPSIREEDEEGEDEE